MTSFLIEIWGTEHNTLVTDKYKTNTIYNDRVSLRLLAYNV